MKVLSLVSQKGGVSKTTLAMNLGVLAERRGYATVVFDLDPQASITRWKDARGDDPPDVVPAQEGRLKTLLASAAKQGAALVIIDTAGSADAAALAAAEAADLILIPARPNGLDLAAVETTVRVAVRHAKRPHFVVLTQTPAQTTIAEEAAEVIERAGVPVCPIRIGMRLDFRHPTPGGRSAVEWRPKSKATSEIIDLWDWICQQLGIEAFCDAPFVA
jgi:chromosome partitioning protein